VLAMMDNIVVRVLSDMPATPTAGPLILVLPVYTEPATPRPKFATAMITGLALHAPPALQITRVPIVTRANLGLLLWPILR